MIISETFYSKIKSLFHSVPPKVRPLHAIIPTSKYPLFSFHYSSSSPNIQFKVALGDIFNFIVLKQISTVVAKEWELIVKRRENILSFLRKWLMDKVIDYSSYSHYSASSYQSSLAASERNWTSALNRENRNTSKTSKRCFLKINF